MLIAHNELGHDPVETKGYDGKTERRCPLYPGMTCRQHVDAAVDIESTRDADLVTVPFIELCPNSWLVPPVGEPIRIPEKDQFSPAKIRARVVTLRGTWGPVVSKAAHDQVVNALGQAEAATDDDDFGKALKALQGLAAHVAEPHAALKALVARRMAAIDEPVRWALEDLVEADGPLEARLTAMRALRASVDVTVYGEPLPALAAIDAWLAKHAPKKPG